MSAVVLLDGYLTGAPCDGRMVYKNQTLSALLLLDGYLTGPRDDRISRGDHAA